MKHSTVLVCGGRDYRDKKRIDTELDAINPAAVVQGGMSGADARARNWALEHGKVSITVDAAWTALRKAAGPIRNSAMLVYIKIDLVLAFPGGIGTADMVGKARAYGIEVREIT